MKKWVYIFIVVALVSASASAYDSNVDIDNDGRIDIDELTVLANYWLDGCVGPGWCGGVDYGQSGSVNMADFSRLAKNWLSRPMIVINEIMYNPQDDDNDHEFLELYNYGNFQLDISGWILDEAVDFIFPQGTVIQPNSYLLVCRNESKVQSFYGMTNTIGDHDDDKLANSGENIVLKTSSGAIIDEVNYSDGSHPVGEDPWPAEPDGYGPSLELFDPESDNSLAASWGSGQAFTPGTANSPALSSSSDIVINEIMYKPLREEYRESWDMFSHINYYQDGDDEQGEYIELFNRGSATVDLSNWSFADGIDCNIPPGTTMVPGEYLVIAADPCAMLQRFGISTLGPFQKSLDDGGERIAIVDATGNRVIDTVRYNDSHPWSIAPDEFGHSLERINPSDDNATAANWRACQSPLEYGYGLGGFGFGGTWLYDASGSNLGTQWREFAYDDSSWNSGLGFLGYEITSLPAPGINTEFQNPASNNIITYYFRRHFNVNDTGIITSLDLGVYIDDGAVVYLNGQEVLRIHMPEGTVYYGTFASPPGIGNASYETFSISTGDLITGDNVLAVEVHQRSDDSSDVVFGLELIVNGSNPEPDPLVPPIGGFIGNGTPGFANSVVSSNTPPLVGDLSHWPLRPASSNDVTVTALVTDEDGISSVLLKTAQGTGITNLTDYTMYDDGAHGDGDAGDGIYGVTVPARVSGTFVHYRVHAQDTQGAATFFPYDDDPSPTKAYFHYDGTPTAGYADFFMFITSADLTLLDTEDDKPGGSKLYVDCSLVIDNIAYPHIKTRHRGRSTRPNYPNSWKFRFNKNKLYKGNKVFDSSPNRFLSQKAAFGAFDLAGVDSLKSELFKLYVNGSLRADYVGFDSPGSAWLDENNYDPNSEVYKGRTCQSYEVISGNVDTDLFHHDIDTDFEYWGSYNKKVRPLEPPDHIRDLVDNLNDLSDDDLLPWFDANIDFDQWFKRWAVHICLTLEDFASHNYYAFLPGGPDGKWKILGYDYDHYNMGYLVRPFWGDGEGSRPHENLYTNKFYQRVSMHPAGRTNFTLARIYLLTLQDILDNYNFATMVPGMTGDLAGVITNQKAYLTGELASYNLPGYSRTPVISPSEGTYNDSVTVSISTQPGWDAYYTTDGSDPRLSLTRQSYTAPFVADDPNAPQTIIATASENGYPLSAGKWTRTSRSHIKIAPPIVINEVLAHSDTEPADWIELYNTTNSPIDISGWFLSDRGADDADLMKYEIGNVTIPANGCFVFYENTHFGGEFALSENGETVYLSSGSGGALTSQFRAKEDFGASLPDRAFGRYYNSGTGKFNFVAMSTSTPGNINNAAPKVWDVVISEIMYNPSEPGLRSNFTDNDVFEFVELYNRASSPVNLYDDQGNPWKFTSGIEFTFPPDTAIAAGSRIVIAKNPAAFVERYPSMPLYGVFGPFEDGTNLDNDGEKLDLSIPGDIDGNGQRQYIRIDRVDYSDGSNNDWPDGFPDGVDPWPAEPDGQNGNGSSLHRTTPSNYGNDSTNWNWQSYSPPPPPPQPPALIRHWKFDETGTDTNAVDAAGSQNGTLNNFNFDVDSGWTTGEIDGGLRFDGSDDSVAAGSNTLGDTFTITAWIKRDNVSSDRMIFSQYDVSTSGAFIFYVANGGKLAAYQNDGLYEVGTTVLNTGQWYHVAFVKNASFAAAYLNGIPELSATDMVSMANLANIIGAHGTGGRFDGVIDDVRIYSGVMSEAEILELATN